LGSRGEGYDLTIFENGRRGDPFGGARSPLPLLIGKVLQPICGAIVFIRKLSIFSFSVGFSENQALLELVCDSGDKVMSSIYFKNGEKTVISEMRVACSRHYYAMFYSLSLGLLFL